MINYSFLIFFCLYSPPSVSINKGIHAPGPFNWAVNTRHCPTLIETTVYSKHQRALIYHNKRAGDLVCVWALLFGVVIFDYRGTKTCRGRCMWVSVCVWNLSTNTPKWNELSVDWYIALFQLSQSWLMY